MLKIALHTIDNSKLKNWKKSLINVENILSYHVYVAKLMFHKNGINIVYFSFS